MKKIIDKKLKSLCKKEEKFLENKKLKSQTFDNAVSNINSKIPKALYNTLHTAFYKSFKTVFEKGTKIIEKTYDKDKFEIEYIVRNRTLNKKMNRRTIKNIDKLASRSKLLNSVITTIEGGGFGILGIGIPDIPIFIGLILKGIYEISMSYGYSYESTKEKFYILNIINTAISTENKYKYNKILDETAYKISNNIPLDIDIDSEIKKTAYILADSMLTAKFIQGIPVVGAVGSITNLSVYSKISSFACIKYKKRFLMSKL